MKKLVFSSLNLDKTYRLKRFTIPGETASALDYYCCCGGKGFNLAVTMKRAGEEVYFAGSLGNDGQMILDALNNERINTDFLRRSELANGHAVIQVDESGQNCIIVVSGSNGDIPVDYINEVLENFDPGDLIILQNEINNVDQIIRKAKEKGLLIAFNPSPVNDRLMTYDFNSVDYLFINEVEGSVLSGETDPEKILSEMHIKYPGQDIILTLGSRGSCYEGKNGVISKCGIMPADVVDTTAAGDVFMGYFLSRFMRDGDVDNALKKASVASAFAVSRRGALDSIPYAGEVDNVDLSKVGPYCE